MVWNILNDWQPLQPTWSTLGFSGSASRTSCISDAKLIIQLSACVSLPSLNIITHPHVSIKHQLSSGPSASQSSKARKGSVGSSRKQTKAKFLRAIRMTNRMTPAFSNLGPVLSSTVSICSWSSKVFSIFISLEFYHACIKNVNLGHPGSCTGRRKDTAASNAMPTSNCVRWKGLEFGKLLTNHFWILRGWTGKWWKIDLWSHGPTPTFETVKTTGDTTLQEPFQISW